MPDPSARKLADAPYFSLRRSTGAPRHASAVRDAIRGRRIIRLVYEDGIRRQTVRQVRPLAIWNFDEGWMFSAWCELRESFRTFRFDRIAKLTVTDECFPDDDAKSLRAFMEKERCEADPERSRPP